jgi:phage host-nuclease inhibitor protein Gam
MTECEGICDCCNHCNFTNLDANKKFFESWLNLIKTADKKTEFDEQFGKTAANSGACMKNLFSIIDKNNNCKYDELDEDSKQNNYNELFEDIIYKLVECVAMTSVYFKHFVIKKTNAISRIRLLEDISDKYKILNNELKDDCSYIKKKYAKRFKKRLEKINRFQTNLSSRTSIREKQMLKIVSLSEKGLNSLEKSRTDIVKINLIIFNIEATINTIDDEIKNYK